MDYLEDQLAKDAVPYDIQRRVGPTVPPKPVKKNPKLPESIARPIDVTKSSLEFTIGSDVPLFQRKQTNGTHLYGYNKVTLDNPAVLDQQLEALEYHKQQLERKGLLQTSEAPKVSSKLCWSDSNRGVSNCQYLNSQAFSNYNKSITPDMFTSPDKQQLFKCSTHTPEHIFYSNTNCAENGIDELPPPPPLEISTDLNDTIEYLSRYNIQEDDILPPPSPVSSSYSELRRANDIYPKSPGPTFTADATIKSENRKQPSNGDCSKNKNPAICIYPSISQQRTYVNMAYQSDYSTFGSFSSQGSSTYESIYEPINPRPPSQQSSQSTYLPITPYGNCTHVAEIEASKSSGNSAIASVIDGNVQRHKETEVEALTDLLVQSMETANDTDSFGVCIACNERVVGENSGCTAMDKIYHISCFTCSQCQINLQGKPFYALDGKPYCESDYLNTLEKCSVCMKPILERILRATGKPYHPQCFTCVVCGKSLDGIPFTVDATNQNYCISDFHKKFAPRCCVCKLPIMPDAGQEETVRVVALDRSFHFECYKCEDCGLLLSSEAEGRGCYPLDDHVLCKSCNAKRVQMLTNRMSTEL